MLEAPAEIVMNLCDLNVSSLAYNSKDVNDGAAFFAIDGYKEDGNLYAKEAIVKGAKVIITDDARKLDDIECDKVEIIEVLDVRKTLANLSCEFYNNPSEELQVIGVTGTKGKTSVTFMVRNILETAGIKTGIIGTVVWGFEGHFEKAKGTTPQSLDIQRMMRQMVDAGCKALVMEVSSQGLMQSRVDGIEFNIGVFTNISPDHIGSGEHRDFEDYLRWKCHLFDISNRIIVNGNDIHWQEALRKHKLKNLITFGKDEDLDLKYELDRFFIENSKLKTAFRVYGKKPYGNLIYKSLEIPLPGEFNVENALAAISTARALGIPWDIIEQGLKTVKIPGRTEIVDLDNNLITMIDYAHNGISLENLLISLKQYNPSRLIVVFGCGGNRDKCRRYEMGKKAYDLADFIIITSDNPRNEDPENIIKDITSVMSFCHKVILAIPDRRMAIKRAIEEGRSGDIIVIAGKGHETYQIIGDKIVHFDDKEAVLSCRKEQ